MSNLAKGLLVFVITVFFLNACTQSLEEGLPEGDRYHAVGWQDNPQHGREFSTNPQNCKACHGDDLEGGTSSISCVSCHHSWTGTHGQAFAENPGNCRACHGGDLKGGLSGVSCASCHHGWTGTHGQAFAENPNNCRSCHGQDLKGGLSGVPCAGCHHSWTGTHGQAFAENPSNCKACHGDDLKGELSGVSCVPCHHAPETPNFYHGGTAAHILSEQCDGCHGDDLTGGHTSTSCFTCHPNRDNCAPCHKTLQSHPVHTVVNSKGPSPSLACEVCHDQNPFNYMYLADGNDLNNTMLCNSCHSPGGLFDGVNEAQIGAKANWETGVYETDGINLKCGKEKWCISCHDDAPAYSQFDEIIIDNMDPTYASYSGTWDTSTYVPGYYGSNYHYHVPGGGIDTFTWTPTITTSRTYEVFARWTDGATRALDATYTIYHNGGSTDVVVDQRSNGGQWNSLGTFNMDGAGDYVELSESPNGYVIADAIMVTPEIVDNLEGTFTGTWDTSTYAPGYYGPNYHYHLAGGGTDTFTWPLTNVTPGTYEVFARWTDGAGRAPDATYTIYHDGGSTDVVVDQRSNGGQWVSLGSYSLNGVGDYVELSENPNGYVIADAITWAPPGAPIADIGIYAPNIAGDNSQTYGFYVTGHKINCLSCHNAGESHIDHEHRTYNSNSDNYQAGYRLRSVDGLKPMNIPKSGGPSTPGQDFPLCFDCHNRDEVLGVNQNDVSHTNFHDDQVNEHNRHLYYSYDSDFDGVSDSQGSCVSCHNVHGAPNGPMIRHGELISSYGTQDKVPALNFGYITSSSDPNIDPNATLANSIAGRMGYAGGSIPQNGVCNACHGPISYYRTPIDPGPHVIAKVIVDNLEGTFTGTWDTSTYVPGYYGTNYHYHVPGGGTDYFTWTPTICTPGTYEVFARWTDGATRAPDATYTIYHNGGSTDVVVDQRSNGGQWVSLGSYSFDGVGDYVELSENPNGYVIADAIMFVPYLIIVDNLEGIPTGSWDTSTYVPGYYGPNYHYHPAGGGTDYFTWTPIIINAGTHEVFARWTDGATRAPDATYTIYHDDGSTDVVVDQRSNGGQWNSLGTFNMDGAGDYVELSESPNGYVIADAIKFDPVP